MQLVDNECLVCFCMWNMPSFGHQWNELVHLPLLKLGVWLYCKFSSVRKQALYLKYATGEKLLSSYDSTTIWELWWWFTQLIPEYFVHNLFLFSKRQYDLTHIHLQPISMNVYERQITKVTVCTPCYEWTRHLNSFNCGNKWNLYIGLFHSISDFVS